MRGFVRAIGTFLGLLFSAYGLAMVFGLTAGAVPCRTECQLNESLKILLGEIAANRVIGGFWVLSGLAFILFMNVRGRLGYRGRLPPKKRSRRR